MASKSAGMQRGDGFGLLIVWNTSTPVRHIYKVLFACIGELNKLTLELE